MSPDADIFSEGEDRESAKCASRDLLRLKKVEL